jgi:ribose transport system permease protein
MATEAGRQPNATATPPAGEPAANRDRDRIRARRGRLLESAMLPLAWVLVIVGFGAAEPSSFLTMGNFSNIFGSQAVLFVLTMALLVPLTNGDIDLSVGAMSGLVSMVVAVLNVQQGMPIVWACVVGIAIGAFGGLVNGFIVVRYNANSFIITLGTGTVLSGLTEWMSHELTITGISGGLSNLVFNEEFLNIPLEFYFGVVIMLVMWYVLTFTPFGQRALFIGQSREVARLSGFNVNSARIQGFVIAGVVAALSGILFVGTTGSASPGDGNVLLLPAFAAAFLGLTTIQPGRFNAIGSGIAVYFLATGVAGLQLRGYGDWVQSVFYGAVLVVAVVISRVLSKRRYGEVATA